MGGRSRVSFVWVDTKKEGGGGGGVVGNTKKMKRLSDWSRYEEEVL